eukprot:gb/GECH01005261.1/.p1 GENE.gb/GECH01005261.1/~~gb/GECH01005261.1/.p1  ORF type:complete len:161 (+),score=56.74 gb/GECH01005261.1/:1-483(+)
MSIPNEYLERKIHELLEKNPDASFKKLFSTLKEELNNELDSQKDFCKQITYEYLKKQAAENENKEGEENNNSKSEIQNKNIIQEPKSKKRKVEIPEFIELNTPNKRISVSEFQGKPKVDLREYFKKEDYLPKKKGIALNEEQWNIVKNNMNIVDKMIEKQ